MLDLAYLTSCSPGVTLHAVVLLPVILAARIELPSAELQATPPTSAVGTASQRGHVNGHEHVPAAHAHAVNSCSPSFKFVVSLMCLRGGCCCCKAESHIVGSPAMHSAGCARGCLQHTCLALSTVTGPVLTAFTVLGMNHMLEMPC